MLHRPCLIVTLVAAFSCSVRADVVFVDAANCPGPGDGSVLNPYCSIQTAIDNAVNTDEVVVAPGTYFETINFLAKAITLRSSDGPDVTIIDGTGNFHVVQCVSGEGPDTVLDGFTITGGNANGDLFPDNWGGGMFNFGDSSPTVTDCVFTGNTALVGGGMLNYGFGVGGSSPIVADCVFTANNAGFGAGMYNDTGSNPTVTDSLFSGNIAGSSGGGMLNFRSCPTVTNCSFEGNAANFGGGMFNSSNSPNLPSSPTVTGCTFTGNTATSGGGMHSGGGSPTVVNCTFSGNTVSLIGGGMTNEFDSSPLVIDCTFSGNSANNVGGGIFTANSSSLTVTNCVLWGDSPDEISGSGTVVVTYTDVQSGWPGAGNIDTDPMFVDPDNGDFRLSPGSPCIDAGNNWGVSPDFADLDEDGDTLELTPWDLDGNPRFVHAAVGTHPGCGIPAVVDMGAYEFQDGKAADIKLGDIDGDGTVGIVDFGILLASWGACEPGCCLADLDLDEIVGIADFLILLGNWG